MDLDAGPGRRRRLDEAAPLAPRGGGLDPFLGAPAPRPAAAAGAVGVDGVGGRVGDWGEGGDGDGVLALYPAEELVGPPKEEAKSLLQRLEEWQSATARRREEDQMSQESAEKLDKMSREIKREIDSLFEGVLPPDGGVGVGGRAPRAELLAEKKALEDLAGASPPRPRQSWDQAALGQSVAAIGVYPSHGSPHDATVRDLAALGAGGARASGWEPGVGVGGGGGVAGSRAGGARGGRRRGRGRSGGGGGGGGTGLVGAVGRGCRGYPPLLPGRGFIPPHAASPPAPPAGSAGPGAGAGRIRSPHTPQYPHTPAKPPGASTARAA